VASVHYYKLAAEHDRAESPFSWMHGNLSRIPFPSFRFLSRRPLLRLCLALRFFSFFFIFCLGGGLEEMRRQHEQNDHSPLFLPARGSRAGFRSFFTDRNCHISLVINIYFLFCRTNSVRDLIFV
jgi:hypothetical protein